MKVIRVRNVNEALPQGLELLQKEGIREESRAGPVLVVPYPVTTVYERPQERVLFSPHRDSNPFFTIMEALWMLAGRNDAKWLDRFIGDFGQRFAEPDRRIHDAYGRRWRDHFDLEGGGSSYLPDQLNTIVDLLRKNPQDRQAVLQMWDPAADLGVPGLKTRPCNLNVCFRVREEWLSIPEKAGRVLDITVFCRSNDIIWGAYSANACQFSVLQEYMAARIGVGIGNYFQISNNYHAYVDIFEKMKGVLNEPKMGYVYRPSCRMVSNPETFDEDLARFMEWSEGDEPDQDPQNYPNNPWLQETAEPLFVANHFWKQKDREHALEVVQNAEGMAIDWKLAAQAWMQRRINGKPSR